MQDSFALRILLNSTAAVATAAVTTTAATTSVCSAKTFEMVEALLYMHIISNKQSTVRQKKMVLFFVFWPCKFFSLVFFQVRFHTTSQVSLCAFYYRGIQYLCALHPFACIYCCCYSSSSSPCRRVGYIYIHNKIYLCILLSP